MPSDRIRAVIGPRKRFGTWQVYVVSYGLKTVAGPRLERNRPLPDKEYEFETEKEATEAAERLQKYLDEHHKLRVKRKRKRRR